MTTSLIVSGLQSGIGTDPTIYAVVDETRQLTSLSKGLISDGNTLVTRTNTILDNIDKKLAKSPFTLSKTLTDTTIWDALYQLRSSPGYSEYLSVAALLNQGLFTGEVPYLESVQHALDILNVQIIAQRQELSVALATIISLLQSSGSSAIVDRLDTLIGINQNILSRLDVPTSTIGNKLDTLNTTQLAVNTQLLAVKQLLDDVCYTPIPYSDSTDQQYINCEKNRLSLVQLLFRALYLPQHSFTDTNRIDYTFVPYLSTLAMINDTGTGDSQYTPQVNKNDPYPANNNFSQSMAAESIFTRLIDPTITKPLQPVTKPARVFKKNGT